MRNIKATVILIMTLIFVLSGCGLFVPEEYREGVKVDRDYPDDELPLYEDAIVFSCDEDDGEIEVVMGTKDDIDDIIDFYQDFFEDEGIALSAEDEGKKDYSVEGYVEGYNFELEAEEPGGDWEEKLFKYVIDITVTPAEAPAIEDATRIEEQAPVAEPVPAVEESTPGLSDDLGATTINIWSFSDEVPRMYTKFRELYPDIYIDINQTVISTIDNLYQPALDISLAANGEDAPDIYCVESAFALKYTQGDSYELACPYADLGIDVNKLIAGASIAPYIVDIGTNPEGDVVGLSYQANGGAFIYRRSIALEVWGSDAPEFVKDKIGPTMDKFFAAAADLKEKGCAIVSSRDDLWHVVEASSQAPWVVNGKLYIDPAREAFLDYARQLKQNGYFNDTLAWTEAWYADMAGTGAQPVFGFFGPAWLINYVMAQNSGDTYGDWAICEPPTGFFWGGTWLLANKETDIPDTVGRFIEWVTLDSSQTGLQYLWANGEMDTQGGIKDSVASGAVMQMSDGSLDFLGGQDIFDVLAPTCQSVTGTNVNEYDAAINGIWLSVAYEYAEGYMTRDQALADFKQQVKDQLGIAAD